MEWQVIAVPAGVGLFIAALLELLKKAGVVPDEQGGRIATVLSMLGSFGLTFGVNLGYIDMNSEQFGAVVQIAALLAQILTVLGGSLGSHKMFKATGLSAR